jgi:hypothetical protein
VHDAGQQHLMQVKTFISSLQFHAHDFGGEAYGKGLNVQQGEHFLAQSFANSLSSAAL